MTAKTIDINYGMTAMSEPELAAVEGGDYIPPGNWVFYKLIGEAIDGICNLFDYAMNHQDPNAGVEYCKNTATSPGIGF